MSDDGRAAFVQDTAAARMYVMCSTHRQTAGRYREAGEESRGTTTTPPARFVFSIALSFLINADC